jgi:hypothetical protein
MHESGIVLVFGCRHVVAIRALRQPATEKRQGVGALKLSVPLHTRVGIATGVVVIGDLIGFRGLSRDQPNRACWTRGRTRTVVVPLVKDQKRRGQVVLLSGEPGIGKSRLTAALLERALLSRIHD